MYMGTVGLAHSPYSEMGSTWRALTPSPGGRGGESWSSLCILPKNEMWRIKLPKWMSLPKMDGRRTKLSPNPFSGKG